MDRLHVGIDRLEGLIAERTQKLDETLAVLRRVVAEDGSPASCPYLAKWEQQPGHDPEAVCDRGCYDEPVCVTGGPWAISEARALLSWLDG